MAIVKMHKISLIGLESDKEQILKSLMEMGIAEIIDIDSGTSEEWAQLVQKDSQDKAVDAIESDLGRVRSAIAYLSKFDNRKKRLFEPKRLVTEKKYNEIIDNQKEAWDVIDRISEYEEKLNSLRVEENRLQSLSMTLSPWKNLAIPLEIEGTKSSSLLLGVIPAIADPKKLEEQLKSEVPESYMEVVSDDRDQFYLMILYYKSIEENALQVLKQYGFNRVHFRDMEGTVSENISSIQKRIESIAKEHEAKKADIAALADKKADVEVLHDYLVIKRDRVLAVNRLAKTDSVFLLECWVPHDMSKKVSEKINQKWDVVLNIVEPSKDEEHPILLKNSPFVQPFEMITQMYSLPSSKEIDPNPFMAPFYFIFFGLMVSDAGYGIVMSLATGFVLWKFKPGGTAKKLLQMLFFGGISTFLWGVLFGGWFGDIVSAVTLGKYTIAPIWFNPLEDPMKLLIWSFIFGGIHIYVGMGLNAYRLIRNGKVWDAIFDIGFWYMLLTGVVMLVPGGFIGTVGKYMAIIGAAGLVLTQGRNEKNIFKKIMSGVLSLYNITGYLSDVLSYSRLLALGLATGVIASVINTMGTIFGINIVTVIMLAVIFVVGHGFNIVINALGAYVHSSRLQYVEFFGKFYEGGGKEFKPFRINTKYVDIKNEEDV